MAEAERSSARRAPLVLLCLALLLSAGCAREREAELADLIRESIRFHASFDTGVDAEFAAGDATLFWVPARRLYPEAQPGLPDTLVEHVREGGRHGGFLHFDVGANPLTLFYDGDENMPFETDGWSGTVSLWLNLSPDEDLAPGFSDPLLITSRQWDNASFFIDFSRDEVPRHFRFAAFPDYDVWNPEGTPFDDYPPDDVPWIVDENPPFERGTWTHVAFVFDGFNTGRPDAVFRGYLNGELVDVLEGRELTYSWGPDETVRIALGINYVGGMDELSIFDRAFTDEEIAALYRMDGSVGDALQGVR